MARVKEAYGCALRAKKAASGEAALFSLWIGGMEPYSVGGVISGVEVSGVEGSGAGVTVGGTGFTGSAATAGGTMIGAGAAAAGAGLGVWAVPE